jgi:hypothetical protein
MRQTACSPLLTTSEDTGVAVMMTESAKSADTPLEHTTVILPPAVVAPWRAMVWSGELPVSAVSVPNA